MTDDSEPSNAAADSDDRPDHHGPADRLQTSLTEFKNDLQHRVRDLVRAKKAAEQLCRSGALENLELVKKYTDWLRDADLSALDMEERRQGAVSSLDQFVDRRRKRRRMQFMQTLHTRADKGDIELEKLADNPLTFYLDPLTVEVDFETGRATLSYAREPLDETDLDPEAVVAAHRSAVDELTERAIPSEAFFDRLHAAYRLARRTRQESTDDRVELVDLLAPLALLASDAEAWRSPDPGDLSAYPKALFAYQLAHLRRDGVLTRDGRRIDLGTATGGSTADKQRVVFIPAGRGDGQYYLSIRFTDADR